MSQESVPTNPANVDPQDQAGLSQVRDLLLGPVSRDLEQRLAQMEQRLDQTARRLEETIAGHAEAMQKRINDEFARLNDDLARQRTSDTESLAQTKTEIESKIAQLSEQTGNLTEEVSAARQATTEELTRETSLLRDELLDRATFSSLFSEMALRVGAPAQSIHGDPSQPDPELEDLLDTRIR